MLLRQRLPQSEPVSHAKVSAPKFSARQQPDGSWRKNGAPVWLTTLFTMQRLRASGVDPADVAVKAATARLQSGLRWNDQGGCWELRPPETGGNTFFEG